MLITRRQYVLSSVGYLLASRAPSAQARTNVRQNIPDFVTGVNISGGEFGTKAGSILGKDYFYPDLRDVAYFTGKGFSAIRVPFRWERLQRQPFAELNSPDLSALKLTTELITQRNAICILDMHNYGRVTYGGETRILGSSDDTVSIFTDAWLKLGKAFHQNPDVWFGLMNEPHGISANQWAQICQKVVIQLRKAGIENRLLVPGTAWTGAHAWVTSGNAKAFDSFFDPTNNFLFEVHQYLDRDNAGVQVTCEAGAGEGRLAAFQNWCYERAGRKAFLGEFGGGIAAESENVNCRDELTDLLTVVSNNRDIWAGWTAWGGGRWWKPDYFMRLQSVNGDTENQYLNFLLGFVSK